MEPQKEFQPFSSAPNISELSRLSLNNSSLDLKTLQKLGEVTGIENLREVFYRVLKEDPRVNDSLVPIDAPDLIKILDEDYLEQLIQEGINIGFNNFIALNPKKADEVCLATNIAYGDAVTFIKFLRNRVYDLWHRTKNMPIIAGFGSARDSVVDHNKALKRFITILSDYAIRSGISCVNGGAATGYMGAVSREWEKTKNKLKDNRAQIVTVLLGIASSRETPYSGTEFKDKVAEFQSPQLRTFLSRTTLLYAVGSSKRANLYFPGGLGTLEELFRSISEESMLDRVVSFHLGRANIPHYLVGEGNFWQGTLRFFSDLEKSGLAKSEDFSRITNISFDNSNVSTKEQEDLANYIVSKVISNSGEDIYNSRSLSETEKQWLKVFASWLKESDIFNHIYFDIRDPAIFRYLDAHYKQQVKIEAEEELIQMVRQGAKIEDAFNKALQLAEEWRPQLKRLIELTKDKETITVIGTAKDIWNERLEKVSRELVRTSLQNGFSLVVQGNGKKGIAKRLYNIWQEEKKNIGNNTSAHFIRIQLKTTPEDMGKKGMEEILGPPMRTLISKTPLRLALGKPLGVVVFPVGLAELDEVASVLLSHQLKNVVCTPYSHIGFPPEVFFLDDKLNLEEGIFQGLREQLVTFVQEGTIDPSNFIGCVRFCNLSNIEESVVQIIGDLQAARELSQ